MNKYQVLNKFKVSMTKYIKCKYDLGFDFNQANIAIENNINLKYHIFSLNRNKIKILTEVVEKDINKYWNLFSKSFFKGNYKKAYRICKYIRKIAKYYNCKDI